MEGRKVYLLLLLSVCVLFVPSTSASGRVIRVKWDSSSNGPGSSWSNAYRTVQGAIDAAFAGDEIWVAAGTYVAQITLKKDVALYGGFSGLETRRDQRNWVENKAILESNQVGSVVTASNLGATTARIDGFTIRNGMTQCGSSGIYCYYSSPTISNNTITANRICGIHCSNSSPIIYNNTIKGNDCSGIYVTDSSSPVISNNTIAGNSASPGGHGIYCYYSSPVISNNIVAFNSTGIFCVSSSLTLRNNCVYNPGGSNYSGISPGTGDIQVDPELCALEYGNVHIRPDSPCVDAGYSSVVQPDWVDMDGQPRIQGAGVDIGADESDGKVCEFAPVVVRVSVSGDDRNDGSGWSSAKRSVQSAIDAVYAAGGGEVWVAAGTYVERIKLRKFVCVYGGFAGNETNRDQRNWVANVTVLDGNQGGSVVTAENLGYGTARVDGFTIRNGKTQNGSGIYCSGSSPLISSNIITGNYAGDASGGIYCYSSSPTISNNAIKGNYGSGVYCNDSSPKIYNNTITGNSAGSSGSGIYVAGPDSSPTISNNVVAFNSSGIYRSAGSPALRNNCVYNPDGYNYQGVSPGVGDIQVDPKLCALECGNVHIRPDSPCVDAGYSSVVQPDWVDMDGQPRIQGAGVDIGADESDGKVCEFAPVVVRVSVSGDDRNDGSSWSSAKRSVQSAIDAVYAGGGEVWVAAGTYVERIKLRKFVCVYGGFAGNETNRDQRNWVANVTILDGNQGGSVVTAENLGYGTARVDGFTIRNGSSPYGGGIYCYYSSPTISNNAITGNSALSTSYSSGGGIYCYYSSPPISNNTITGNSAYYGGGIYCSSSSPTISNNTITRNSALYGGGIGCNYSSPPVFNNIVAFNSSGIYRSGGSPTLRNNCVYNPGGYNYSGISPGTGDIQVDPLFADRMTGDYHLRYDSPCIDAGYDDVVQPDWLDIDGQPRKNGVVDIGSDEYYPPTVSGARLFPDGLLVDIHNVVVTGTFDGFFYVESADRTAGIQVRKTDHGVSVGVRVNLTGALATDESSGERYIAASSVQQVGTGSVAPLALTNRALGGGDWMWNPSNGAGQRGVSGGVGLNNIGLLVRTTGRVISSGSGWFVLDDGSGVNVKCVVPSGVGAPDAGSYVVVTGISSCERVGDEIHRLLRVRSEDDIVAH